MCMYTERFQSWRKSEGRFLSPSCSNSSTSTTSKGTPMTKEATTTWWGGVHGGGKMGPLPKCSGLTPKHLGGKLLQEHIPLH